VINDAPKGLCILNKIAVIGTPRSGSSYLTSVLLELGCELPTAHSKVEANHYEFNADGYFEDTFFTLLNDQIIRIMFGENYSFLNPPDTRNCAWEKNSVIESIDRTNFSYDLVQDSVDVPEDFTENLIEYTGQPWDVWGLSRMTPGKKWHGVYSQLGIHTAEGVSNALSTFQSQGRLETTPMVYKDSRLTFTLPAFGDFFHGGIFLTRDAMPLKESMRGHYGKRLFTESTYAGHNWVSNHFNFKVPPILIEVFLERYERAADIAAESMPILRLNLKQVSDREVCKKVVSRYLTEIGVAHRTF
jgi:hypothetical protein